MKNSLQRQLKGYLKHWYLGGGTTENRAMLDEKARKIEPIAYRFIMNILSAESVISKDASPY